MMVNAVAAPIAVPSVLAFERKMDPSDALFYSGKWDERDIKANWAPVPIDHRSLRTTISNRLNKSDASDPAKLDAKIENPNLQEIDFAALPFEADTLKVEFFLRILGDVGTPSACNETGFGDQLAKIVSSYRTDHSFRELAGRYAYNLANGRFLWRNRVGAESVEVHIKQLVDGAPTGCWRFNACDFSLRSFPNDDLYPEELKPLRDAISSGLSGNNGGVAPYILLQVTGFARLGCGQKVFPSEEMVMEKSGSKGTVLFRRAGGTGMHSQKIGNAIRTIDTWYESGPATPISIETYGSVTNVGKAFRNPKETKRDFYTLFDSWVAKGKMPSVADQHFVMAMLIRGGVFGQSGKINRDTDSGTESAVEGQDKGREMSDLSEEDTNG